MKFEREIPVVSFVPLTIIVESKEEQAALHYLGCAVHQIVPYQGYLKTRGKTFDCSADDLNKVLSFLRNWCN